MRNSTIKQKMGVCAMCTDGKDKPLISGLCQAHYWQSRALRSYNPKNEDGDGIELGLPALRDDADAIFSLWLRLTAADDNGYVKCFICDGFLRWQDAHCMHYIKRENMYLRYDVRNCKVGCYICNKIKGGNYIEFAKRLEAENPGITDFLIEESGDFHKPFRVELNNIINEYSLLYKQELKKRA